jgi:hypothetical protein
MKFCEVCLLACTFLFALTENCLPQSPMVPWLTRSADNSRSGWNLHETQLTQASVESKGIIRATDHSRYRGCEGCRSAATHLAEGEDRARNPRCDGASLDG